MQPTVTISLHRTSISLRQVPEAECYWQVVRFTNGHLCSYACEVVRKSFSITFDRDWRLKYARHSSPCILCFCRSFCGSDRLTLQIILVLAMQTVVIATANLSVRLSVSHVPVFCPDKQEYDHAVFSFR